MAQLLQRWSRIAGAVVAALAMTATATAAGNAFTVQTTRAGTAAALAVAPVKADLGKAASWTGGYVTVKPVADAYCPNYRPRYSDLVVTGVVTSQFIGHGVYVRAQSRVLRTKEMVKLHWQRSIRSPNRLACSRKTYGGTGKPAGDVHSKLVSVRELAVPQIAPYSFAFRQVTDVTTATGTVRVALVTLEIARGRTEITLTASAPLNLEPGLLPSELALGKVLISRART